MAKQNLITLPRGIAIYPALHRPDTRFDELGTYKADVKIEEAKAKPFMDKLSAIYKEHTGKAPSKKDNPMWSYVEDDEGNETGEVHFKIRVKNKMRKDGKLWDRRPMVMDAKKASMDTDVAVWGGSVMRVQMDVYCWVAAGKKGVSLQPVIVQVIDLKTGSGAGDMSEFDEEEGYETDDNNVDTSDFSDETGSDDDGDADY